MNDTEQDETYEVSSDVIFGADGAYSRVRYGMQKMPRFNYSQDHLPHVYKELTIPAGPNGEYLIEKNALHIWPRGHFMMIALPNFDGSFTCTLFVPHEGADHIHDIKTPEQVSEYMQKHFADAVALMPNMIEDFLSNPISNLVTVRCFPWINGKTALIGDASHAIVPFYGQGMNSGFEDVRVLDDLLESGESDWSKILDTYQNLRKPNGDAIAELALNNFIEMRDLVADPQFIFRKKIEKYLHEKMGDEFTPLYNLVSFSNISYKTALDTGYMQNRLFADLFKEKDLESKWDSEFTVQFVKNWMQQNNL
jgi:kynurenine 3-monooxygenase